MSKLKSFVIATRGRTGSTALADAVDQIEDVRCFAELLSSVCLPCKNGLSDSILSKALTEAGHCQSFEHYSGVKNLDQWWLQVKNQSPKDLSYIGFKVVGSVWSENQRFLPFVKEHLDVIHLTRDPVMQAISGLYARELQFWNVPLEDNVMMHEFQSKKNQPVFLNPSEVALEATYAHNWQIEFPKLLHGLKGKIIEVQYEEIFDDQRNSRSINELCEYFSVNEFSLGEARYAQNLTDYEAQVLNLEEVKQHLVDQELDVTQLSRVSNL